MFIKLYDFLELQLFGVCSWWSKKLGIKTGKVRLYFIYLSFIAFGSPLILYLVMAFILDHKFYFKPKTRRNSLDF
jgi:phage shock protein C